MFITGIFVFIITTITKEYDTTAALEDFRKGDYIGTIKDLEHFLFALIDILCSVACIFILILNYRKKFKSAIISFCIFAVLVVSVYYLLGGERVSLFFLIPLMLPVVFFDKKKYYFFFAAATLILMYAITVYKFSRGSFFYTPRYESLVLLLFLINFTVAAILVFIITVHFKKENLNNQMHLMQKNLILQTQSKEISTQSDEIVKKNSEIEQKNTNITDSINYAKNIQTALLPRHEILDEMLPDHFILLKPRDIVSGDFYWFSYIENLRVIAAVDCTGHGVPGAFMSMLGSAFLNEIVNKEYITHTGVILRRLRKEVIRSLHQKGEAGEAKDGMDMAICVIDYATMKMQFSGANNPIYLVRSKKDIPPGDYTATESDDYVLYDIRGDHMPVSLSYTMENFRVHEINFMKGDMIYLFSDGYADQFGGPDGKKFSYKRFRNLLLSGCSLPLEEQCSRLEMSINKWKGDHSQIDDIMVLGIRL
jgi:serine phosphatase RsbU (regulator of sigma subunit)